MKKDTKETKKSAATKVKEVITTDHEMLQQLVEQNAELLEENNRILKKIHRNAAFSFWIRVVWYLFLIGFPFALYFYVLEPYFAAFGTSYDVFIEGLNQLPGLSGIDQLIGGE
tara:strand:- start:119 stop:457 length:339 start_codon:yes stop_codon:yes gene_type:complete